MPSVADCLRQHAPAYLEKFGERIPLGHRMVIAAITRCRTGALGGVTYQCQRCERLHWVGRSCGNRHCPNCQADKTQRWLARRARRRLPLQHFMVTFTVPEPLRAVLRAHQRQGYAALFECGSETIRCLLRNPKYLGSSRLGFYGVLHTWGRDPMAYHPHVHFVVPGGGVSEDGATWLSTPDNFLFPHAAAIWIYKAKFADAMRRAGLYDQVPAEAWRGKWVVNVKPVGDGLAVTKYLAPYVYRVAISDKRIVACDENSVTYRYTPSGKKRAKTRTVEGTEFIRGFVQHCLPRGFQKVRHYGWQSPNTRIAFESVKWLVWLYLGWTYWLGSGHAPQQDPPRSLVRCAACGGPMQIVGVWYFDITALPTRTTLCEHSVAYLDSG
jgi:hypothetical protein